MISHHTLPEEVLVELGRTTILYAQIEWTVAGLISFLEAPDDGDAFRRTAALPLRGKLDRLQRAVDATVAVHGVGREAMEAVIKHIKEAVEWRDRLIHGFLMLDSDGAPVAWRIHKENDSPHALTAEELQRTNGNLSAAKTHLTLIAARVSSLVSDSRS